MSGMKKLVEEWLKRSADYTSRLKGGTRDVLTEYQENPHFINRWARNNDGLVMSDGSIKSGYEKQYREFLDAVPALKEAFRGAPTVPEGGLSVYRVGPRDAYPSGGLAHADPGVISTSRDWEVPDDFLGYYNHLPQSLKMRLGVPEGSPALDLTPLTKEWAGQKEVLLPPGLFSSTGSVDRPVFMRDVPWFDPVVQRSSDVSHYLGERNYSPDLQWLTREGFRAGGLVQ